VINLVIPRFVRKATRVKPLLCIKTYMETPLQHSHGRNIQLLLAAVLLMAPRVVFAQNDLLALSSGTASVDGTVSLSLNLTSPSGSEPAALQWTFSYPTNNVLAISAIAGPSVTNAGKTLNCVASSGTYTCLVSGLNTTTLASGTVASLSLKVAAGVTASTIDIVNPLAVSGPGNRLALSATGGVVIGFGLSTTVPTAPTNLSASTAGMNQINLGWAASTASAAVTIYLIERCQGVGCTSFAQIATPPGTAYSDISLSPGSSYSYRVRAMDAAGNLGPYSNVATAITKAKPQPPQLISTAPATGSGFSQTFTITVADGSGASNVGIVYFLVNSALAAPGSCYAEFNSATNTFQLENDAGTGWLGPVTLGTATSVANSQCTIDASKGSSLLAGDDLSVSIPVNFGAAFVGAKNLYALAYDATSSSSGWLSVGTWTVTNSGQSQISVVPVSGSGFSQTFTVNSAISTADGSNSSFVYFLVNPTLSATNTCLLLYSSAAKTFQLRNDANTNWLGPITLGTATSIANHQCAVSAATATVTGNLTLTIPLSFAPSFAGAKNIYAFAFDNAFASVGWLITGTWTVPTSGPPTVVPTTGSGSSQTFAVTVDDASGAADISLVYFLINSSLTAPSSCYVEFNNSARAFRLLDDAGADWLGPITLGSAASLANSQCTVSAVTGSSSSSGNLLTVNVPVSFAGTFQGTQNVYAFSYDNASIGSGWQVTGAWTIP